MPAILILGLVLRVAHWLAVREHPFFRDLILDSADYDQWAVHIAAGHWLGTEPFHQAPLYPYLLALVYSVFGRDLDLVYLLQVCLSLGGLYALFRCGSRLAGRRIGLAAAGLAAVYGPLVFHDVQLLKESAAVTVVCFLLWVVAAIWQGDEGRRRWLAAGVLLGVLILLRENAVLAAPFLIPVGIWRQAPGSSRRAASTMLVNLTVAGLGAVLVLAPVVIRNAAMGFGITLTSLRGGVNFYIGNNPEADGTYQPIVPGRQIPEFEKTEPKRLAEADLGRSLTPGEVSRYWFDQSMAWAKAEPLDFLALQGRKMRRFWSWYEEPDAIDYYYVKGLSPALGLPLVELAGLSVLACAGLLLAVGNLRPFVPAILWIVGWTASVVPFFVFSRFRLPMIPALALLAAIPICAFVEALQERHRARSVALLALLVGAFLLPVVLDQEPKLELVHHNLGILLEGQGHPEEAAAHYRKALDADPNQLGPTMNLGNLAIQRRDFRAALTWYGHAVSLEPRSDDAWAGLGGAQLAVGEREESRSSLHQALALNPGNLVANYNLALLFAGDGETGRAMELVNEILDSDPEHEPARRLRDRLRRESAGKR